MSKKTQNLIERAKGRFEKTKNARTSNNKIDKSTKPAKTPIQQIDEGKMFLATIKDGYIFEKTGKDGSHAYAVYKDKQTKEVRAIQTTHIYTPDKEKQKKLKTGELFKVSFPGYETPSGVNTNYYNKNAKNEKIDLKDSAVDIKKEPLSDKLASTILSKVKGVRKINTGKK